MKKNEKSVPDLYANLQSARALFHSRAQAFNASFFIWCHALSDSDSSPAQFFERGNKCCADFDAILDAVKQIAEALKAGEEFHKLKSEQNGKG